jgi:hypothetical protein
VIINEFLARDGFEPLFAAQMTDEAQVAIHIQGSIDEVKEDSMEIDFVRVYQ